MKKDRKTRDPIPDHFGSIKDAAEFWDNHDLSDYQGQSRDVFFQVDIRRRQMIEMRREEILADIRQADAEFEAGRCRPTTPADLMNEIKS
jgi:hypothetical protein